MKFDVLRDSDFEEGRVGENAPRPIEGAVLNKDENRWELEVKDLEELLNAIEKAGHPVLVLPAGCRHEECADLPVFNIIDTHECVEEEPLRAPSIN
jgi:hypothetical protein